MPSLESQTISGLAISNSTWRKVFQLKLDIHNTRSKGGPQCTVFWSMFGHSRHTHNWKDGDAFNGLQKCPARLTCPHWWNAKNFEKNEEITISIQIKAFSLHSSHRFVKARPRALRITFLFPLTYVVWSSGWINHAGLLHHHHQWSWPALTSPSSLLRRNVDGNGRGRGIFVRRPRLE